MKTETARIEKMIHLVGTSPQSWEHAAQNAVAEAAKSVHDLGRVSVIETDITRFDTTPVYRIKLEISFQLDRNRVDDTGTPIQVRRYLIVANQTLASPGLGQLIDEKVARFPAEFHVIVPQTASSTVFIDPVTGAVADVSSLDSGRQLARGQAEARLGTFMDTYRKLGSALTGEVVLADPLTATRAVMARASFDEIIVSTLAAGVSRWLKLDLPHRLERTFNMPVVTLTQDGPDRD